MCTAITYRTRDRYFGRTLDFERSYGEQVVVCPRRVPLNFMQMPALTTHYAMLGMATVAKGYPLYFDAVNENGLAMAGLMFAGYAHYRPFAAGQKNAAPFEMIPWVLGQCADLRDVEVLLEHLNITDLSFDPDLPSSPLHWLVADREHSMVIEAVAEGIKLYQNPVGVLTNSPPFDHHLLRLQEYGHLSPRQPSAGLYSRGLGAYGLPGDYSSVSRFVRATFVKSHARGEVTEKESVERFFHILDSVWVPRGCVRLEQADAYTRYACCCNQDRGIYYYTTCSDRRIIAVDLHQTDLEGKELVAF